MEFEVKVERIHSPRNLGSLLASGFRRAGAYLRAALSRRGSLIVLGLAGFVLLVGTPHVAWEYRCHSRGLGSCRGVAWCAYYGVQGRRVVVPRDGAHCSIVTVLPLDWEKITRDRSAHTGPVGGASQSRPQPVIPENRR